jgi:hypothetical protein
MCVITEPVSLQCGMWSVGCWPVANLWEFPWQLMPLHFWLFSYSVLKCESFTFCVATVCSLRSNAEFFSLFFRNFRNGTFLGHSELHSCGFLFSFTDRLQERLEHHPVPGYVMGESITVLPFVWGMFICRMGTEWSRVSYGRHVGRKRSGSRGAQMSGARLPRLFHFVWWRLNIVWALLRVSLLTPTGSRCFLDFWYSCGRTPAGSFYAILHLVTLWPPQGRFFNRKIQKYFSTQALNTQRCLLSRYVHTAASVNIDNHIIIIIIII